MGFYGDVILPYCVDLTCGAKELRPEREKVCADLRGRVLEVGFGSGLNVPYFPAAVSEVRGVDPSARALAIATERLRAAKCKIEIVGLDAQRIAAPDGWADTALSTFTLCTIDDVGQALSGVRRILKPGGSLCFLEHGLAPDASVRGTLCAGRTPHPCLFVSRRRNALMMPQDRTRSVARRSA